MAQFIRQNAPFQTPSPNRENNENTLRNEDKKLEREWDTPTRKEVKILKEFGWSQKRIRHRTNVPERSQSRIITSSTRRPGTKRKGATRKLSDRSLNAMIRHIRKSFENRQITWKELAHLYGNDCDPQTVKTALGRRGYYKCKACQMSWLKEHNVQERLDFAKANQYHNLTYWRSVRFTDEVHFALESRAAAWVIRTNDERCEPTCIQYKMRSDGSQLHCWAMVGYNYKGPLVFYDSNDNSEPSDWIYNILNEGTDTPNPAKGTLAEEAQLLGDRTPSKCKHLCKDKELCKHRCCKAGYRNLKEGGNLTQVQYLNKIFRPYVEKAWQEAKDEHRSFLLMEDNDGSHGTRTTGNIVARYKAYLGIPWYCNVARSPDLNIIENVWRILKQRVKQRVKYSGPLQIDQLRRIIQEVWAGIDLSEINKLVVTMPKRIDDVIKRGGLNTPF